MEQNQIPNQDQIKGAIEQNNKQSQFGVFPVPYHVHNETDAPKVIKDNSINYLTYGTTVIINPKTATFFSLTTSNIAATCTISLSSASMKNEQFKLLIIGGATNTIVFGTTSIKTKGNISITSGSASILVFASNGTNFYEVSRTTGL